MTRDDRPRRFPLPLDLIALLGIFAGQAFLILPLFAGDFTQFRGSIETTFIANAQFIAEHFPDLTWYPDWYLGFPFELFYTPLLPTLVAVIGKVIDDVPHAYRLVAAIGFALGAPSLYLAAKELTRSRRAALLAAAAFVFLPSASYLFAPLLADSRAFSGAPLPPPWRLTALVEYGEGPHVLSLSLSFLAIAACLRYLRMPSGGRLALAVAASVAVALTNLIGALGVAVFLFGIAVTRGPASDVPRKRGLLVRLGALTVLFSLGWYSLGFMAAFSKPSGGDSAGAYILLPIVLGAAIAIDRTLRLDRLRAGADVAVIWLIVLGSIVVLKQVFGVAIAPQPIRYTLEFDAAVAVGFGIAVAYLIERFGQSGSALASIAFALTIVIGLGGWSAVQTRLAPDVAWRAWSERQVALWLEEHVAPGERVFASGSHGFWLNVFAGVPQIRGGQDFSAVDPWPAHATYQITTGNDAEISVLWLQALGVRYLVVPGPASSEIYRDFVDTTKFDKILRVAYEQRGVRIFEVPLAGDPRAVVLPAGSELATPTNGIDRAALDAYVRSLTGASKPASVQTSGLGHIDVTVETGNGADVVVRQAADSGWRATIDGAGAAVTADALGLARVTVPPGRHVLALDHGVHRDFLLGLLVAAGTGLWLSIRAMRPMPRLALARGAALEAAVGGGIVAIVVGIGAALGAWSGFPKGVDAGNHLTRLKFVADWFPHHDWLYAWAAGMPSFDNYPGFAYVAAMPFVLAFGPEPTLKGLALVAMVAFALGLYGHLRLRGVSLPVSAVATLMALTSMSVWQFITYDGVYARVTAMGFAALAWWAHAAAMRRHSGVAYALTALLLALAVGSHPVTGAFAAAYVAITQVGLRGWSGVRAVAGIAGVSLLLAAQPITSPLTIGIGGRILGVDRPELGTTNLTEIYDPLFLGLAALSVPLAAVIIAFRRSRRAAMLGGIALLAVLGYIFAPNVHVPTRFYYINGIDPNTVPYFLAIVGAFVFAFLAPPATRFGRGFVGLAAFLVALNVVLAVPAMKRSAYIADTTLPMAPDAIAQRTLVVDGDDLRHRILPLTATEAVWFNYVYRKPQLRDYYTFGLLNPDWLYWVFDSIYHPPLNRARFDAILDWYALDSLTNSAQEAAADATFAKLSELTLIPSTRDASVRQYRTSAPAEIAALTTAPLVVIVGSTSDYDRVARLLFDEGASPRTLVPLWWPETLATLPDDLASRAASVIVVGDHLGDDERAAQTIDVLTRHGARLLWDLGNSGAGTAPAPWPARKVGIDSFDQWNVADRLDRIREADFSPALFDGGPWKAAMPQAPAPGATTELALDGRPLVVSSTHESGTLTVVGGNLLYHAQSKANIAERRYVLSFITAAAANAERAPSWRFVDPQRREVDTDGSPVILKESFYPKWGARFVAADGSERALSIHYVGPGLIAAVPPGPGTVIFVYDATLPLGWLAWGLTLAGVGLAIALARRRQVFTPAAPRVRSRDAGVTA